MPGLAAQLPPHHPASRFVSTVEARTKTPADVSDWIAENIAQYKRLVNRLLRCRNAQEHGGPLNQQTAESVRSLARGQAKQILGLALWAVASGKTAKQQIQAYSQDQQDWLDNLSSLHHASDAFR